MKAFAIAAAFLCATSLWAEVQKQDVDIKSPDGVNLKATYYSPGRPGPAMLLLHQCNMDRHAWDGLAADGLSAALLVSGRLKTNPATVSAATQLADSPFRTKSLGTTNPSCAITCRQ